MKKKETTDSMRNPFRCAFPSDLIECQTEANRIKNENMVGWNAIETKNSVKLGKTR